MAPFLRLWPAVLFAAVLIGCAPEAANIAPQAVRTEAPEISGVDADGKEVHLSDFRGKVVLVDFWFDA